MSIVNNTYSTVVLTVNNGTTDVGITLIGKNYTGYGESVEDSNFRKQCKY